MDHDNYAIYIVILVGIVGLVALAGMLSFGDLTGQAIRSYSTTGGYDTAQCMLPTGETVVVTGGTLNLIPKERFVEGEMAYCLMANGIAVYVPADSIMAGNWGYD